MLHKQTFDLLQKKQKKKNMLYVKSTNTNAWPCSVAHSHSVVSVLLFCLFAVWDAALDILAGKQGPSVFGSVGADV